MDIVSLLLAAGGFIAAHWAEILGVCYALINLANALVSGPEAKSKIEALADFLAFLSRKDAAGTLKAPGAMSKAPASDAPAPKSPPDLKALVALPLALLLGLQGCAFCRDAANAAAPRCVLEANMVKCGESAGFALLPVALGLLADAIAQKPFDAQGLEQQLMAQGVKDVPCVLAALYDFVAGSPEAKSGSPLHLFLAEEIHAALAASLAKRGMRGRLTLRIRPGHQVDVEVE